MSRKPRAYRLDDPDVAETRAGEEAPHRPARVRVEIQPEEIVEAAEGAAVPMGRKRRFPWGGILLTSLSALVLLALGLAAESLVRGLFEAAPWLGWVGLAALALALLALAALVIRELAGLWREKKIEALRARALDSLETRDGEAARRVVAEVVALYAARPETARGRGRIEEVAEEILEAEDRLAIAERELLADLDARAARVVADAAKQVSLVTALSPRAAIDVGFVVFNAARVLRRVSAVYGARPGALGFIRLMRAALTHLTVTGGVAVGDGLLQQALGLGIAARVSARLGEGVLNGIMTARFGLAAIAVCRPLPFVALERPKIGDVAGELISRRVVEEAKD
ncbi:TIGR01620 family protein [Salinarimonas sp.]|uniref:YcjF family protein n=1 Tax=Salinarimonas sp. TaxID=2766526 RepID=UPI0032D9A3FD